MDFNRLALYYIDYRSLPNNLNINENITWEKEVFLKHGN